MSQATLPKGWRVENLGLISAVKFSHSTNRTTLMWCDGSWTMGSGNTTRATEALHPAGTMKEARSIGTAWITKVESS